MTPLFSISTQKCAGTTVTGGSLHPPVTYHIIFSAMGRTQLRVGPFARFAGFFGIQTQKTALARALPLSVHMNLPIKFSTFRRSYPFSEALAI